MNSHDDELLDALRREGWTYTEIGRRLGKTKDAVRGAHVRWLGRGAAAALPGDVPIADDGSGRASDGRLPAVPGAGRLGQGLPEGNGPDLDQKPPSPRAAASSASPVKSEIDMARAAIAKVTRAEVRLKHSLLADAEINAVLAERLRAFDIALQSGVIPALALTLTDEYAV